MPRLIFPLLLAAAVLFAALAGERRSLAGPPPSPYALAVLPPLGGDRSRAEDINDSRQVCGWADKGDDSFVACLWTNGVPAELGTLGGDTSTASALNNVGQVCGDSGMPAGPDRAFLWTPNTPNGTTGIIRTLPSLIPNRQTFAADINTHGDVCGWAADANGKQQACVWRPTGPQGTMVLIPLGSGPGGAPSAAWSINDDRTVAGTSLAPSPRCLVWTFTDTPARQTSAFNQTVIQFPPGADEVQIGAVDEASDVVVNGLASGPGGGTSQAWLLRNGFYSPIPGLGISIFMSDRRRGTMVGTTQLTVGSPPNGIVLGPGATEPALVEVPGGTDIRNCDAVSSRGDIAANVLTNDREIRGALLVSAVSGLDLSHRAFRGNRELKSGDSLVKRERIRYEVTLTNNSGADVAAPIELSGQLTQTRAPVKLLDAATAPSARTVVRKSRNGFNAKAVFPRVGAGKSVALTVYCEVTAATGPVQFSHRGAALVNGVTIGPVSLPLQAVAVRDASDDVVITLPAKWNNNSGSATIKNTLANGSGASIGARRVVEGALPGPMYLILDGLQNATVRGKAGVTRRLEPLGSAYVRLPAKNLPAGKRTKVKLRFRPDADGGPITFTPRFAIGPGRP